MPLARIITSTATDCGDLESDLRARGFEIDRVAPEESPSQPADLEIRLEEYAVDEVLSRAAEAAQANDVSVFIAPGAIVDSPRPVHVIRLQPPVASAPAPQEINLSQIAEAPERVPASVPENEPEPVMQTAVQQSVPSELPPSAESGELQELVAELEMVMPEILDPVVESAEDDLSTEVPCEQIIPAEETSAEPAVVQEDIIEEEIPEPVLSVMEDESLDSEPTSDWPIWNPPVDDELVEPVMLRQDVATSTPPTVAPAMPVSPRPQWVHRVAAVASSAGARLTADRKSFRRVATVTGVVAVAVLLFGASWHRRSPLPVQLTPAAQASSPLTATPPVTPASRVNSEPVDRNDAAPLPLKQVVERRRVTNYAEEENLIAPDTVVRFDRPRGDQPGKSVKHSARRKAAPRSGNDIVAKDTVVRYGKGPSKER